LPATGTVQVESVVADWPGRECRPKKYCVPSAAVTFQYSPLSSWLEPLASFSIFDPSSVRACQPFPDCQTSSLPWPLRLRVAFS
jgi:hypothetical protein